MKNKKKSKSKIIEVGPLTDLTGRRHRRKYQLSRRALAVALNALADELIDLCPFSSSPDDVSEALGRLSDRARELSSDMLARRGSEEES